MKIAIVVAMQTEFDMVKDIFTSITSIEEKNIQYFKGKIADNDVVLMKCGIGKVNSAVRLSELLNAFSPDLVINSGVAGGIDASVNIGEVVVGDMCCYHDVWCGEGAWGQVQGLPLYFRGDAKTIKQLQNFSLPNIHFGLICTGDQFVTHKTGLQTIKKHFPQALAVDMESASMAHICYQRSVPFLSIRVVSDTPDADTDNETQYFDFWENAPKRSFAVLEKLLAINSH